MSLTMTALRLQAIAALNSHPVIARLCEGRIYDSRIGDFDHREPVPVIVVTTEECEGEGWSENNGGAPFDDRCNLVLEIAMNTLVPGEGDTDDLGIAVTDRELESTINLIEWCAEQILTTERPHPLARPTAEGLLLTRAVTKRVEKRSISRFSSDETGERLAIHLVTFLVALKEDEPDALNPPTGVYAGLPEPLRLVCEAATAGSSAEHVCQMIAADLLLPELRGLQEAGFQSFSPDPDAPFDAVGADFPTLDPPDGPTEDSEPVETYTR